MAGEDTTVTLAVTTGDPRGIGPEIVVKALRRDDLPERLNLLVVGSAAVLAAAARRLDVQFSLPPARLRKGRGQWPAILDLDNFPVERVEPRTPDALSGRASLDYIEEAVTLARGGQVDGIVTGPISKEAIAAAGSPFPGHTEMIASLTDSATPVMLLVSGRLRVALLTTHLALRDVPGALRAESVVAIARVLDEGLRRFYGIARPRLAVCGLNPHCGDGGRFGDEEERVLGPAVAAARDAGIDLDGPEPADSVFLKAARGDYDAVLAAYHDQGMVPVKMAGLDRVINVTLGIPIIRTSVGHGTAYDIAGTGRAHEGSLVEAIRTAAGMARNSGRTRPQRTPAT